MVMNLAEIYVLIFLSIFAFIAIFCCLGVGLFILITGDTP